MSAAERVHNTNEYAHLADHYFTIKMRLFIKYFIENILQALAYYGRFEYQWRGIGHIHFIVILKEEYAPNIMDLAMKGLIG